VVSKWAIIFFYFTAACLGVIFCVKDEQNQKREAKHPW
jgi:hypothetical protein